MKLRRTSPRKKGKNTMTSMGEEDVDEPIHEAAPGDDDASSPLEEREGEVAIDAASEVDEATSQKKDTTLEKASAPTIARGSSSGQALEVPKFRQPRQGSELPLVLSVPMVVPPSRRRNPVEPIMYVFKVFPSVLACIFLPLSCLFLGRA